MGLHLLGNRLPQKWTNVRNVTGPRPKPSSRADYFLRWDKRLEWVDEDIHSLTLALSAAIGDSHSDIIGRLRAKYYCFYRGRPCSRSIFVALLLYKFSLGVRIKVDPFSFKDPQKWTGEKMYRHWFFPKGPEREFRIDAKEQIAYAMKLIKQSYDLAIFSV